MNHRSGFVVFVSALTFAIGATVGPGPLGMTAAAAPTGISFEQIDQIVFNAPSSLRGEFAKDAAALAQGAGGDRFPAPATNPGAGLREDPFGSLRALQTGVLRRFSFLNGMSRVDDLGSHKATIGKPNIPQVIYLDLDKQTYRTIEGDAAKALLAPPDLATILRSVPSANSGPMGTETIEIKMATTPNASRTFEGVTAAGFSTETTVEGTNVTGQCPPIHTTMQTTTYVDAAREEPLARVLSANDAAMLTKGIPAAGCTMSVSAPQAHDSRTAGFVFYRLTEGETALPVINVTIKTRALMERGNVKPLTPADAGLFAIPPGFTPAPPVTEATPITS